MPLQTGTRLGPYEIETLLAAGGMGEVYRARDPRLGRIVAIKVLPPVHVDASERVARFAREARAAAALNHPNILAVHDVGTSASGPYLVSELLQGQTLRAALVPGQPWPVRKVLDAAAQIANGLAAAHARGIVHRDLKPENLFICHDGTVKILDFGLARLAEVPDKTPDGPTETLTREHTVLGTVGYMAPEQVRGQPVDHRADLFAFGAVLYEVAAGRRAFSGDTAVDTITAILSVDPPDPASTDGTPPQLARIIMRCLEKRPEARFQSASDLAFALKSLSSPELSATEARPRKSAAGWSSPALRRVATLAVPIAAAAAVGLLVGRFVIPLPGARTVPSVDRLTDFVGLEETPSMSPDGKSVAFTAGVRGIRQVFVRLLTGGNPLQITSAPQGCESPRWSADSSSIVCFSPGTAATREGLLWDIPALGGPQRRVAASLGEADIRKHDGRLVYFRLADGEIELVTSTEDGSSVEAIGRFPPGRYYWHPRWSPDGRTIAFQQGDGLRFDVFVVPAAGGEERQLTHDNALISGLSWQPDGRGIVYSSSRGSTMPYLPTFALWQIESGSDTPRQLTSHETSYVDPDVREDGRLVAGRVQMAFDIWKFPTAGPPVENVSRAVRVTRQTGHVQTPTVGPDDDAVAFLSDSGGHANIWVIGAGTGERQITHERDSSVAVGVPLWSPDGRSIAFVSSRGNVGFGFGIWTVNPDGGNVRQLVPQGLGAAWSADGRWIYYVDRAGGALKKVAAEGGPSVPVRADGGRNVIGHDGSTVFYVDERPLVDGTPEYLIKAATPDNGEARLVSRLPASRVPNWQIVNPSLSPDRRWLAQALTDGFTTNLWILPTEGGDWRQITDFGERVTFIARRVDWSRDGRFIFAAVGEGDADIVLVDGLLNAQR